MQRKDVLAFSAVLILTGSAALASAQQPGPMVRGGVPPFARIKEAIGLSDAQLDQLARLVSDQRKLMIRTRADMQVKQLELQDLMLATTLDETSVAAKAKEVSDLEASTLKARVSAHLALRKVLTPEQVQKLRTLRMFLSRSNEGRLGPMPGPMRPRDEEDGSLDDLLGAGR
jgi:Spy/CpxP family protein refolding chaperone